jgi:hypothetical protein
VKILFNDDSSISIGSNTSLDMREYADAGSRSAFGVHVPQGVIRVITGKLVDQNPSGFRITTPEAMVGIRGTIVSLRVGGGSTTVYVENTLRQVYVNNIHVPSGSKITLPGDPARPTPIQPEDRRELGRDLAFRGGAGTAAAAPEPAPGGGRRTEQPRFAATGPGSLSPDTPLADLALSTQYFGDRLVDNNLLASGPGSGGGPLMGHVNGSLGAGTYSYITGGSFSFDVFLSGPSSGVITNGTITFMGTINGTLNNGIGFADSTGFKMAADGLLNAGTAYPDSMAAIGDIPSVNLWAVTGGFTVPYHVDTYIGTTPGPSDEGVALGTITRP